MKTMILSALLAALPMATMAADPLEDAVEARHGYYIMLGMNMGTLAGMAKGEVPYDEAAASRAAANIEALSKYDLPALFPAGTAHGEIDDSNALPAIWTNNADFVAKFEGLQKAAAGAAEAVKGGQANVGPVVQNLGAACKACHDTYRKPES